MRWVEFTVCVPSQLVEAAAAVLAQYTTGGVSIEESFTALEEGAVAYHRDKPVRLAAYLPEDEAVPARRRALRDALTALLGPAAVMTTQLRDEEEWAEAWKQFFHVEHLGRIVIRPSWRPYTPAPGEVVIDLDPGMAFGTGQHPTTRMALEALGRLARPGMRVLDLGTGSGILAIAAAKLGADEVLAVDIDAQAVRVAQENVAVNGLAGRVQVAFGSLAPPGHWPFAEPPNSRFDLVLANTSAATIILLARNLIEALAPQGCLVAGGIIRSRAEAVRQVLEQAGGTVRETIESGDWYTFLVLRREEDGTVLRTAGHHSG